MSTYSLLFVSYIQLKLESAAILLFTTYLFLQMSNRIKKAANLWVWPNDSGQIRDEDSVGVPEPQP